MEKYQSLQSIKQYRMQPEERPTNTKAFKMLQQNQKYKTNPINTHLSHRIHNIAQLSETHIKNQPPQQIILKKIDKIIYTLYDYEKQKLEEKIAIVKDHLIQIVKKSHFLSIEQLINMNYTNYLSFIIYNINLVLNKQKNTLNNTIENILRQLIKNIQIQVKRVQDILIESTKDTKFIYEAESKFNQILKS